MTTAAVPTLTIDRDLEELREGARRWIALSPGRKAELLAAVRRSVATEAGRWAQAGSRAKGVAGTPLEGEEWISGPWAVLYALNRYIATLRDIARTGAPQLPKSRLRERADGQLVADVYPVSFYDKVLLNGIRAEVWMERGVTRQTLPETLGIWYRDKSREPLVALVLGAGNISSIAPLDVLYKLVADGAVCILKMNPVNEYLGPIFEAALKPLVDGGYLRFAYGGAEAGKYLTNHPGVDEIHITGSDKTFDAIVFGGGPEGVERKARNEPLLRKPISSELGNVSPTIVVPGSWSEADFAFQAQNIVTQKLHNGGFNCIASQVLVVPSEWPGTQRLLDEIARVMRELADRPAYYPGAAARQERLAGSAANVQRYGRSSDGFVPRTIIAVGADDETNVAFRDEAFGSVLAVKSLAGDTSTYLKAAVRFANESLWGTLGANLIVHPKTMRDYESDVDDAVAGLRYGCIGVNAWTGVGYFICETPWGAYPGHMQNDIQSGTGVVHNSHLFSRSEKSVIYAPFAPFPRSFSGYGNTLLPKPPWFVTNSMAANIGRALCAFEVNKNPLTMAHVALLAMRA